MKEEMDKSRVLFLVVVAFTLLTTANAQKTPPSPSLPLTPSPAPAPELENVNLTALLSVAGPFHTFLSYLTQTKVIQTFQAQVNDTKQHGITIFVPSDAAFSRLKKPSLSNLTQPQLKSLLLYHALPQYYSLAEFKNLSRNNPVSTFGGGDYKLNFSDTSGLIRIDSGWSNPKISSSVFSTKPVAIYEVHRVLLPVTLFGTPPPPAPAPAPAPETSTPSDLAPSDHKPADSPKSAIAASRSSGERCVVVGYFLVSLIMTMMTTTIDL